MKTEATKQGDNLDVAKVVRDKVKKVTRKKKKPSSTAKAKRTFPLFDIEESRKIPDVIKQLNAGNPWDPKDIAAAIGMAMANNFYYLSASSRDYGLTLGTRDTEKIELSELGKKLVYPKSALAESEAIQEAFRHVELFKKASVARKKRSVFREASGLRPCCINC